MMARAQAWFRVSLSKRVAATIGERLAGFIGEATNEFKQATDGLEVKRKAMVALHRAQRRALAGVQTFRAADEARERGRRFRKGLLGLWDRVSGRHAGLRRQNEAEAELARRRDADERQALIDRQLVARRQLQAALRQTRHAHLREVAHLQQALAATLTMNAGETPQRSEMDGGQTETRRRRHPGLSPSGP